MSDVILRSAHSGELGAVLTFWRVAAEDSHRPVDTAGALAALHLRDPEALIVAVDHRSTSPASFGDSRSPVQAHQDEIVGTIIAGWDGWRCHLYRLAVRPSRRREGIGQALIAAAEERFRALGGTRADAMVLDENEAAHGIWRQSGYGRQQEWARWVKPL